ncbi:hypothetical protein [Thiorhodococcus minor]|uniref:Autotransporter outer membrane beta-barrel domain-containing protein n=1 Tax=Thiorhodococcus minor TaxID=57489 RepID=A0A6M0JXK8_9GAMM|nr:hypothetical protein [Thiorhodococcus minor]NEV61899.1 hypothetical protein [Thiorhodococcus minor]
MTNKDSGSNRRQARLHRLRGWLPRLTLVPLLYVGTPVADEGSTAGMQSQWTPYVRGGYVHQLGSELEGGGNFSVDRAFLQAGLTYAMGRQRRISLAIGAGTDSYDMSAGLGLADAPWERVDQLRLSLPITWAFDERWSLFALPTLRSQGESGVGSTDATTGGALAAIAYRVGERLTIGPGLGALTQLEDSISLFPILVIDWQITDRLSLQTGRGLGASQGPGLELALQLSDSWSLGLGGRSESLRFRLSDDGPAPNGVGEDSSVPLYLSATYARGRDLRISAVAGMEVNGELRLEDASGRRLAREDYDRAPFLGATFEIRF